MRVPETVNRLHALLTRLLPAGAPRQLSAETAAQLLRTIRPRTPGPRTLRRLAAELIAEVRHLDRRITAAAGDITAAVAASNTALTELCGIGDLTAEDPGPGWGTILPRTPLALVALRAC